MSAPQLKSNQWGQKAERQSFKEAVGQAGQTAKLSLTDRIFIVCPLLYDNYEKACVKCFLLIAHRIACSDDPKRLGQDCTVEVFAPLFSN
jgi:hypothetical protein